MSDSVVPATPSSSSSGGFLPRATLIHVACEALLIGIVFFTLNRKLNSQQSDLIECAVRIAAQNKRITELEDRLQDMSSKVTALSSSFTSLVKQQQAMPMFHAPPPTMMPRMFPSTPAPQQQTFVPAAVRPPTPIIAPVAAPVAASVFPTAVVESFQQPFLDTPEQQIPIAAPIPASIAIPLPAADDLDREIADELDELTTATQ